MGSLSNPKIWVPYTYSRLNCSQRQICSLHCPQCCYNIIFPPPPPPTLQFPADHPSSSALLIAIIGVLASALLLITYYVIISKYCVNKLDSASPSSSSSPNSNESDEEDRIIDHGEQWVASGKGLDESMIKSIAIFKYKMRGDGIIVLGTECSVCLSEFQDDESLKLLPNCTHPFHVNCIDTWLKSHSNCPLCRANIVMISPSNQSSETSSRSNSQTSQLGFQHIQDQPEASVSGNPNNSIIRVLSDLGRLDTIIEIGDHKIRRTVSMDNDSVADVLRIEEIAATSKRQRLAMKASFSRHGRLHYDSHFMNISPVF